MKFYKDKVINIKTKITYLHLIEENKLTAICCEFYAVLFYKNGLEHNYKNASYVHDDGSKEFILNGHSYGYEDNFTKKTWHKFCKLQAFL